MKTVTLAHSFPRAVGTSIALGMFDGVHMGHRRIISAAKNKSTELEIPSSVLLFSRSPKNASVLLPLRDRLREIEKLGIDTVYVYDFEEISGLTPEEFVQNELCEKLGAKAVFAGYNYRFGKGAAGSADTLASLCADLDIFCGITEEVDYLGESVSSSRIRALLADGDVETANKLLTYPYYLTSEVLHGKELGRKLGLPTINQHFDREHAPMAHGIYYTKTIIDGRAYISVSNLGVRPTVENTENTNLETHIIGFDGDLYGREVKVEFYGKGRDEKRFADVEELRREVERDCRRAIEFFK
ncbi:MAG: riboflavin biosynthesis protein RibF [Clostridia bacterium]|nr:riboflavin biosynthesis protein RibF [Clostridia bacterium]